MEEDIKRLEERIKSIKNYDTYRYDWIETDIQLVENLIKGYRELEKSKITYERVRDLQEENKRIVDNNYILKSKIKENIEPVIDSLEKNGFVGYADELRDIMSELMEDK